MLKQSGSRNQRAKGFKVKHAIQITVLLLVCLWLLYRLKQSYIDNSAIQVTVIHPTEEVSRLGRKGLINPQLKEVEEKGDDEEEEEIDRIDQEKVEEEEPEQLEDLIDEDDKEERISKVIQVLGQQA